MKDIKHLYSAIDEAIRTKRFIGGLGHLKKDGSLVELNGQIFKRHTTKDGDEVIIIDNFKGKKRRGQPKRWQMVLVKNLVALNNNRWRCTRVA